MSQALKLLNELTESIFLGMFDSIKKTPGAVVLRLSAEKREILKNLTSDDVKNIRPDLFGVPKSKGRWGL